LELLVGRLERFERPVDALPEAGRAADDSLRMGLGAGAGVGQEHRPGRVYERLELLAHRADVLPQRL
jgi:hypothetical protein